MKQCSCVSAEECSFGTLVHPPLLMCVLSWSQRQLTPSVNCVPLSFYCKADVTGKIPSLEDAFLAKRKPARLPSTPVQEDSAWDGSTPQIAWSASGSSMLTAPDLEPRASQETRTHTRSQSVSIDKVSKSAPRDVDRSVGQTGSSPSHAGKGPGRAAADGPKPGGKFRKFLTWLTDPDTRDAARAQKHGKPIQKGALYDLATPIGRCPV